MKVVFRKGMKGDESIKSATSRIVDKVNLQRSKMAEV